MQSLSLPPGDTARTILRLVRAAQPISRADLARRLDVNRSTVTEIVKPLLAAGVLCEAGPEPSSVARVGRPPIGLSLRDQESFFIGVNLGVRRSQVGAASVGGQLLAEETFETPAEARPALNRIRVSVERMRATMHGRRLLAIGVSVPGPTDAQRSRLLYAPHLGWQDVAISAALAMKERRGSKGSGVEVPVIVENDATAAASYEARRRLGSGGQGAWRDFVLVRAGTGIGAGLVVGGEVYQGSGADGGLLGEFGHMTIVAGGKVCVCGNRGCWERYASAASAVALYAGERRQMRGEPPPRFAEIVARAEAGELRARATLEKTGEYLGIGIGNIMSGMGVTRVVVSGRIVLGWKYLKKKVEEAVGATMAGRLSNWKIEAGEAEGASVGGAVELVIEQHLAMLARLSKSAA